MVTLNSYPSLPDAVIVKGMLEANDIPAVISDYNNPYVPVFGGVELRVREEDYERARQLLETHNEA